MQKRLRYSHLGCNVVHEDIAFAEGVDVHAAKRTLKHLVEVRIYLRVFVESLLMRACSVHAMMCTLYFDGW